MAKLWTHNAVIHLGGRPPLILPYVALVTVKPRLTATGLSPALPGHSLAFPIPRILCLLQTPLGIMRGPAAPDTPL